MLKPPAPYRIRPMTPDHLDAVLAIDKQAFPTPTKRSLLAHEISENALAEYHILLEQEQIIGYDGFWMLGDEMHISTIAVDPAYRGKGLGELLLLNMLHIAQQNPFNMITLEVREGNHVAQALYTKYQFEIVGERKGYYRDTGEDALLMTREPLDAPYRNFLERARISLFARLLQ